MPTADTDTICAIATSPGRSGIGVIRVSGPMTRQLANTLLGFLPRPRHAHYTEFLDQHSRPLDRGIALFFPAPNSFTGEDVLELQGHGGLIVMNRILQSITKQGIRVARPGEFSERSFLNGKMDLLQLEAVADLIDASTEQAARSAYRTLEGEFSRLVNDLVKRITELRVFIEASIDFSDEEIDFLSQGKVAEKLETRLASLENIFSQARQGTLLKDGMTVVIAGKPNAGKSSLLNRLSGRDSAIVTDLPGTTRDVLRETINLDGIPLHIIDTAGLRPSVDVVEKEGIHRARKAIAGADMILLVIDSLLEDTNGSTIWKHLDDTGLGSDLSDKERLAVLFNKTDRNVTDEPDVFEAIHLSTVFNCIAVSASTGYGIDTLQQMLKQRAGYSSTEEGNFIARQRHLDALQQARSALTCALGQVRDNGPAELIAEDLRLCQQYLGEITGQVTSDELLGKIFGSFCIGK